MKIVPNPLVLFALIIIVAGGLAYAQPQLPKGNIPKDIAPNLKNSIEKLYSSDAGKRADSAEELGEMGSRAIPAVPYLIDILENDVVQLHRNIKEVDSSGNTVITRIQFTSLQRVVAEALKKITKKYFGEDPVEWRKWWKKSKDVRGGR